MDRIEQLRIMGKGAIPSPREEKIRETIEKSKDVYFFQEEGRALRYWEFLWGQLRYTRKRWWVLQGMLLWLAWWMLPSMEGDYLRVRGVGVIGCLFVVLMIPELWRNKSSDSIQVEAACLYSLRQVYAARITLFGMVDTVLLSIFGAALGRMGFTLTEVLAQFLIPVTVTACICFALLCGKANLSESIAVCDCVSWAGLWWLILMNENVYERIVPAVWVAVFGIALVFLGMAVRAAVRTTNQYWEVAFA